MGSFFFNSVNNYLRRAPDRQMPRWTQTGPKGPALAAPERLVSQSDLRLGKEVCGAARTAVSERGESKDGPASYGLPRTPLGASRNSQLLTPPRDAAVKRDLAPAPGRAPGT